MQKKDIFEQKQQKKPINYPGILSLLGGFLIQLVIGAFYLWGNLNIYITSYYRLQGDLTLNLQITSVIFPIMGLFLNVSMLFGIFIAEKIGFKVTMLIITILLPLSIFISSFMPNFWVFTLFYGIIFGILAGFTYMLPIHICYSHFPNKRGLVTGVVLSGSGIGALVANQIVLQLMNPNNVQPQILDQGNKYFDDSIAYYVPQCLRWLSLYYLCVGFLGAILIQPRSIKDIMRKFGASSVVSVYLVEGGEDEGEEEEEQIDLQYIQQQIQQKQGYKRKVEFTFKEAFKTKKLYKLIFMSLVSLSWGFFIANNFKNYGILQINDDQFMTIVGSIGALANGFSRVFWGIIIDYIPFKKLFFWVLLIQLLIIGTISQVANYKALYFIYVLISFVLEASILVMFLPQTIAEFGRDNGSKIYSIIFIGFAMSNFLQYFLVLGMKPQYTYDQIFWVFFGLSIVALIILVNFKQRKLIRKEFRRKHSQKDLKKEELKDLKKEELKDLKEEELKDQQIEQQKDQKIEQQIDQKIEEQKDPKLEQQIDINLDQK